MNKSSKYDPVLKIKFFNTMIYSALLSAVILASFVIEASSQTGGSVSIAPAEVETGTTPTVTVIASGFFDLSEVTTSQVGIRPDNGVENLRIVSSTAQRMTLRFQLTEDAAPGIRTFFIKDRNGATVVALDLTLKLGAHICRPECVAPMHCQANNCKLPSTICNPVCSRENCESCINNRCVEPRCQPACDRNAIPPEFCECGRCVPAK